MEYIGVVCVIGSLLIIGAIFTYAASLIARAITLAAADARQDALALRRQLEGLQRGFVEVLATRHERTTILPPPPARPTIPPRTRIAGTPEPRR